MSEESRGITADPEVRQQEYQEAEVSKDQADKSRVDAAMAALVEKTEPQGEVAEVLTTEQPPQEEVKEGEKEESKSELYARLAEQDYKLQQLKKQAKQASTGESVDTLKQKASENPLEVLNSLGLSMDELLDRWVDDSPEVEGTPQEEHPAQENPELVAMKEKLAALEAQNQQKEYQGYLQQEQNKVHNFVNKEENTGKWPLVQQFADKGAYKDVLDTAMAIYQQNLEDGTSSEQEAIPSYDVVIDMVEDYYVENIERTIKVAMGVDKFKHYFNNTTGQKPEQKKPVEQKKSVTLSPSLNDTASPHEPTEEERMKNAIAAMESTLAKGDD